MTKHFWTSLKEVLVGSKKSVLQFFTLGMEVKDYILFTVRRCWKVYVCACISWPKCVVCVRAMFNNHLKLRKQECQTGKINSITLITELSIVSSFNESCNRVRGKGRASLNRKVKFNPIAYGILQLSQLWGWDFYPIPLKTMLKLFN